MELALPLFVLVTFSSCSGLGHMDVAVVVLALVSAQLASAVHALQARVSDLEDKLEPPRREL